jgi:hypothetical protein
MGILFVFGLFRGMDLGFGGATFGFGGATFGFGGATFGFGGATFGFGGETFSLLCFGTGKDGVDLDLIRDLLMGFLFTFIT